MSKKEYCYWECLIGNEVGGVIKASILPVALLVSGLGPEAGVAGAIFAAMQNCGAVATEKIWGSPFGVELASYFESQMRTILELVEVNLGYKFS